MVDTGDLKSPPRIGGMSSTLIAGKMKKILGISAGDPAGIGMEVSLKALNYRGIYGHCAPLLIGDRTVAEDVLSVTGLSLNLHCINSPEEVLGEYGTVDLLDMRLLGRRNSGVQGWDYGKVSEAAGNAAFRYVERAVRLAMEKRVAAMVTAPINKAPINLAGCHYAGHTEILSDLTGIKDYAMVLVCGKLRVIHVTTHVPLKSASELITETRILKVIRLARMSIRQLKPQGSVPDGGKPREPKIAVAGFNPHASESGLFGDEEEKVIIPAIMAARAEGINVEGPVPSDTVFVKAMAGQYDIVVAMYHDQGHIPLKLSGFKLNAENGRYIVNGINLTIGLPIIRTSVDHGTAFDIAGKNCSSEQSMIDAIETASLMASNNQPG